MTLLGWLGRKTSTQTNKTLKTEEISKQSNMLKALTTKEQQKDDKYKIFILYKKRQSIRSKVLQCMCIMAKKRKSADVIIHVEYYNVIFDV